MPVRNPGSTGGGTPGGSDTQVQFNDGSVFGGDAGLVYDKTTDSLTISGHIRADGQGGHSLGGGPSVAYGVFVQGEWDGSGAGAGNPVAGFIINHAPVKGTVGGEIYGFYNISTIEESSSGNHPLLAGMFLRAPIITAGSATVTNTASVYINSAPSAVVSGANYALWIAAGGVRMGQFGAGAATFDANGNISSVSDLRHKKNVVPYMAGLAEIRELQPVRYNWTAESKLDTARTYVGFGAQDVRPWLPDAVDEHRKTGDLSFNPHVVIAALVNAVQTLASRLDALDGQKEPAANAVTDWAAAVGLDAAKFLPDPTQEPVGIRPTMDDR